MDKQKDLEEYVVKHKQEIDEMRNVCDGAFLVVELYDIVKLHKAGYRKEEQTRKETAEKFAERLKAMAYQSTDWSHGEHPMVVEVDYIDEICEEITEGEKEISNETI